MSIHNSQDHGLKAVVLRPAYAWDCEECGVENFTRGLVPEFSESDLQALRDEHGVDALEAGDFVAMPDSVICCQCGATFDTIHTKDA